MPQEFNFGTSTRMIGPKFLLYSHDTFGLGNIRRTLLLAQTLRERDARSAVLILTGSPMIHAFRIPDGTDYVKLPSLDRVGAESYEPKFLQQWSDEVLSMRRRMLREAVAGFEPDLVIVDKRPAGIDGEFLESLELLTKRPSPPRIVLGIRDILDEPARTRETLLRTRSFETIRSYYDEVWIYGSKDVFDATKEYGYPEDLLERVQFCGYLGRRAPGLPRKEGPRRVVVATGGGGDGSTMINAYLEGLLSLPRSIAFRSTIVLGPEMPTDRRDEVLARYGHLADVEFCDFDPDPLERYSQADVVVSMAGYNTVCELLSVGRPTILVPRAEPVAEQLIRARRLSQLGWVDMIEPDELQPRQLIEKVVGHLEGPRERRIRTDLDATDRICERITTLLDRSCQ